MLTTETNQEKERGILDEFTVERPILIVDDELVVANLIKRIIERSGYQCIVCTSPFEAFLLVKNLTPELIFRILIYRITTTVWICVYVSSGQLIKIFR